MPAAWPAAGSILVATLFARLMLRFYPFYPRLLPLAALLLASVPGRGQTIYTEAAAAYWQLTDALRRDEPLTNTAWQ